MSDVSEPGWSSPEKQLPTEAAGPQDPRQPRSPDSSRSIGPDPRSERTGSSFPGSDSPDGPARPDPAALVALITEGLKLATSAATWLTRKRIGIPLRMEDRDARALAKPVSRLIARRFNVKGDLNDAADTVGVGAALMNYLEGVATRGDARAGSSGYLQSFDQPAREPAPTARSFAEDAPAPTTAAVPPSRPPAAAGDQRYEVGSGPVKSAYLAGYDD